MGLLKVVHSRKKWERSTTTTKKLQQLESDSIINVNSRAGQELQENHTNTTPTDMFGV